MIGINQTQEEIMRNLCGTLAVEGITLSPSTKKNIQMIADGAVTYEAVIKELTKKHLRAQT